MGRDMGRSKDYSESTAQLIDGEVKQIVDNGFETARNIIQQYRDKLEIIAKALLEYETLDGKQVEEIVKSGTFTPPPVKPGEIDPPAGAQASTPMPEIMKPLPPKLPGFGTAAPAAA